MLVEVRHRANKSAIASNASHRGKILTRRLHSDFVFYPAPLRQFFRYLLTSTHIRGDIFTYLYLRYFPIGLSTFFIGAIISAYGIEKLCFVLDLQSKLKWLQPVIYSFTIRPILAK